MLVCRFCAKECWIVAVFIADTDSARAEHTTIPQRQFREMEVAAFVDVVHHKARFVHVRAKHDLFAVRHILDSAIQGDDVAHPVDFHLVRVRCDRFLNDLCDRFLTAGRTERVGQSCKQRICLRREGIFQYRNVLFHITRAPFHRFRQAWHRSESRRSALQMFPHRRGRDIHCTSAYSRAGY